MQDASWQCLSMSLRKHSQHQVRLSCKDNGNSTENDGNNTPVVLTRALYANTSTKAIHR